jgi:hypothetical protein
MAHARSGWRRRIAPVALGLLVAGAAGSSAQIPELPNLPWVLRYNAGQNVQPIFHGWARNADGSFTMHYGYLNRNYVEQVHVPVGPHNTLGPGGPDQGQPTYFYPRFRNYAFSVDVPSDWGERRLVWEVTVNGRTDRAEGWLQPEWEINPPGVGGPSPGLFDSQAADNRPPTMTLESAAPVTLPDTATLVANVRDDGLPTGGPDLDISNLSFAVGQETPPTLQPGPLSAEAPVNIPQLARPVGFAGSIARRAGRMLQEGVTVTWTVWRGPSDVAFEPLRKLAEDGRAVTTATFTRPGDYVLRATASDRARSTVADLSVTVRER